MSVIAIVLASCVGAYAAVSIVLLRWPTLIHRRKIFNHIVTSIAHRGGGGEKIENTIAAFQHAISNGCNMLELDVWLTADGAVVVAHDDSLARIAGVPGRISETKYADLPKLKAKIEDINAIRETSPDAVSDEERTIPLFDDVLRSFSKVPLHVDCKTYNPQLFTRVNELIVYHGAESRVLWGAFSDDTVHDLYQMNPNIGVFASLKTVVKMVALFYTGLLPFFPMKEAAISIPFPKVYLSHPIVQNGKWYYRTIIRVAHFLLISPILFAHLKRRGIQVYVWVLNTEDEWRAGYKSGATAVMTDYPTTLNHFNLKTAAPPPATPTTPIHSTVPVTA